jgi:hypothetical protein
MGIKVRLCCLPFCLKMVGLVWYGIIYLCKEINGGKGLEIV